MIQTKIQDRIENIVTSGRGFSRGSHISDSYSRTTNFQGLNREELELLENQEDLLKYVIGKLDYDDGRLNETQKDKFYSFCSKIYTASIKLKENIDSVKTQDIDNAIQRSLVLLACQSKDPDQTDALINLSRKKQGEYGPNELADALCHSR